MVLRAQVMVETLQHGGAGLGVDGPFAVSTAGAEACVSQWAELQSRDPASAGLFSEPYEKSAFAYIPACRDLALQRALTLAATRLIGEDDLVLATMSVLLKGENQEHRWHSDIENVIDVPRCDRVGYTAWLPISGSSDASTLLMITGTQSANQTAQAVHEQLLGRQCKVCKLKRGAQAPEARGDALAKLARARGMPGAALWRLAATDGSAWFFRGATWHASVNRGNGPRLALQMHYMPARCAFRRHDSHQLAVPRASDLHVELPPVVPLLGRASPTLASPDGTLRNNWLLLDETEPVVVDAPFDATKVRVRGARKSDLQSASVGQRAHNLSAAWAAATCVAESGVDPRAGLVDLTKCKKMGPNGHTAQLRIIEYHTSKLRRNNAAHELREHEEVELLYMLHGHVIVTLRQGHPPEHRNSLHLRLRCRHRRAFRPLHHHRRPTLSPSRMRSRPL